ncbi:MAG: hypothetical protein E7384_04065 [Ruminococcaceae bacterium]|nr:hypothetical protein [Oscillospiraceae bacterium]
MKKFLLFCISLLVLFSSFSCKNGTDNLSTSTSIPTSTMIIPTIDVPPTPTGPTPTPNISGVLPEQEVKIVDINIDGNTATAQNRASGLISTIISYEPDSIGVQESRDNWNTIMTSALSPIYGREGTAADGQINSRTALSSYIYYNKLKYNVVDSGTFWLSKTPYRPSIYGSTVDCNRTCVWVILEHKYTKFRYVHMSTHLDWMDKEATRFQVSLIRDQIKCFEKMGLPVFAGGDFNTSENTTAYKEMFKVEGIANAKYVAAKTMNLGTYPDYGKNDVTKSSPIDHVFVTEKMMDVIEYKVIDEKPDGQYFSDHNGLFVHAKIHSMPDSYMHAKAPDISGLAFSIEYSDKTATASFEQPQHSAPYDTYKIHITDRLDRNILITEIHAKYLNESTISFTINNKLSQGATYHVKVTATDTFGLQDTYEFEFTVPQK